MPKGGACACGAGFVYAGFTPPTMNKRRPMSWQVVLRMLGCVYTCWEKAQAECPGKIPSSFLQGRNSFAATFKPAVPKECIRIPWDSWQWQLEPRLVAALCSRYQVLWACSAEEAGGKPHGSWVWKGCRTPCAGAERTATAQEQGWYQRSSVMKSSLVMSRSELYEPALQGIIHAGLQQMRMVFQSLLTWF